MVQPFDDHDDDDDDFDQLLKVSSRFDAFDSYGSIDAFEDFDAFEDLQRVRSGKATTKTSPKSNTGTSVMNNKPRRAANSSGNHIQQHTSTKTVQVQAVAAAEKHDETQKSGATEDETYGNGASNRSNDLEQWQRQWSEFEGREGVQCLMDANADIEDDEDIVAAAVETATMTVSRLSKRHDISRNDSSPSPSNNQPYVSSSLALREDAPPTPPSPSVPRTSIDISTLSSNNWQRPNKDMHDEYETMADGRRICQDLSSSISSRNNKEEICSSSSTSSSRRSGLIGHKHSHFSNTNNCPSSTPVEKDLVVPTLVKKAHGDFSSWKRQLTENTIRHEEKSRATDVEKSVPSPPPSSSMVRISSIKLAKQHMIENSILGDNAGENVDIKCHNVNGRTDNETWTDESQERTCCGDDRLDNDSDDVDDDCSVLATISVKGDDCIEQWRRELTSPIPDDQMGQRMLQEDSSFSSSPFDEEQFDRDIPKPDDAGRSEMAAQDTTSKKLHSRQSENDELFPLLTNQDATESKNDEMALASSLMKKNTEDLAAIKVELGRVKALIQEPLSSKRTGEVTLAQNLVKKKTEDLEAIKVELGRVKALIKEPLSQKHESSNETHKVKSKRKTKKSVKFSSNLITNTYYRPKTLPEEIENLYWDEDELDRWEEDRVNTSPDRIEVTLSAASSLLRKSTTKCASKSLAGKEIIGVDNQMGHTILHCNQYHDDDTVSNFWIETESLASF